MIPQLPHPSLPEAARPRSSRVRDMPKECPLHRPAGSPPVRRVVARKALSRSLVHVAACALLLALLPACAQRGAEADAHANAPQAEPPASAAAAPDNKKEDKPVDAHAPTKPSQQPPAPDAVLYFIYNKDGDGATSYEIENGSVATYWYGYEFDLGGKHYFTGFAYDTPEKYGPADASANADPLTRVTLTEATFVRSRPGTPKPWSFRGAERFIGEFGSHERANALDASRQPQDFATLDGRLVLAVPTIATRPAPETRVFSMFVFDPEPPEGASQSYWTYLGDVLAGEGRLRFEARDGLPALHTGGGEVVDARGQRIPVPETYVHDESNNAYLELQ